MNVITRMTFDNARTKAVRRFGTSNLHFSEYPIFGGWKLDIRLAVMANADRIFDMDYGEIRVTNGGATILIFRHADVYDTIDELLDVLADRLSRMVKDYKDYVRIETERLLEAL